ncbi:vacuolar fusion protein CCZ1 homolog [Lytechinus variegatus]|uniref:vacuolar fusion protein CCZ1 homolog n=1 Tax=Lytechinus variegatus TaxID=7654 RepID=UPI001BB2A9F6|nr:vacuolar fusion protein CCZ1 homolog [Lytechinus variegatus]
MTSQRSIVNLSNFFIYNTNIKCREGEEHKKIMFYHPSNIPLDMQTRHIGLCMGVIMFTETFDPDKPCHSMHTQKTRQLYLHPEEDFWVIMTVTIPFTEKVKDGKTFHEYHEDDVQDSVYLAVLKHAYHFFKLFMGTFSDIMNQHGLEELKQRLSHFFSRYLSNLRLSTSDILEVHNGIQFLPLDKNTYLRIQCFINLVEASFTQIKYTAFLYNNQLVWSGLEQDDMRVLYKYLTTSHFPSSLDTELKETPKSSSANHYGKFVMGPQNLSDPSSSENKVPKLHITKDDHTEELFLIVYRAMSATICLMVEGSQLPAHEWYQNVDSSLGPQLSSLASDIGEQYANRRTSSSGQEFKFVYFNQMNLAQKTTVHDRKTLVANINPETLRLIADINADFEKSEEGGETLMRTMSDCWVVGKKSDQREFYVVINQKNSNLIEINEEVKRLCSSHFSNIFFLD